ncbi:MAG: Sulfite exporter TauE/SafE [Cytophagaceae bacterium]|jgi:uncharacterized membrane protein YfcA|nr:Sulfite exporter TauE/SafE [Cytophagaceae bacterium]
MEIIVISIAAFITAILTFFSGFGLGTILTPVFLIFFPVDLAIALTGIVHFCNNLFKVFLVGKHTDKDVLLRFGIPAVIAAFIGSWLLLNMTNLEPLFTYYIGEKKMEVFPVKFILAILLIFFVLIDFIPYFKNLAFGKEKLPIGGALSGFFGGLSGVQGALRSAFLVKAGLSKEAFVATTVVIACFVDFTRLSVYATRFSKSGLQENIGLVIIATLSAIAGAYIGNLLLKKVSLKFVQVVVAVMLILISVALGAGLI